ncbi:MAG: hemin-degrading factor [Alphaproteobacteria bacterium]|jgi:putative hemin transport protein|nr:hemin-degrading factor [Alphaproteobacteria bacterium]
MDTTPRPSPEAIRQARAEAPKTRERDLAERLGISEAQLVAAHLGDGATAIAADPDTLLPAVERLGPVMALTRNEHCVIEVDGRYSGYEGGEHAAMVLGEAIDLRLFPRHWVHAFAVKKETETGKRRSLQVFDAAGQAVHKIFLRDHSDHAAWAGLVAALRREGDPWLATEPRLPAEGARMAPDKAEVLRREWRRMSDTHQFLRLVAKLKMNRLGAYRLAGAPFVRRLDPACVPAMLGAIREAGLPVMIFCGNRGCIQIRTGPVGTLTPMGPWENVLDPGFNLHLRRDRAAELWAVEKPTRRGPATSVEAFAADGTLIFQVFGVAQDGADHRPAWQAVVADLPDAREAAAP